MREEIERGESDRAHDSIAVSAFFRLDEASCVYEPMTEPISHLRANAVNILIAEYFDDGVLDL